MPRIKKPKWVQLTQDNFQVGAIVRVNPDVPYPRYGWGGVKPLDEGIVISGLYDDGYKM